MHIKSVGRRGTASYYLGDYKGAKHDFILCLRIEPNNSRFRKYLEKTLEKIQKVKSEAYEKMTRRVLFTDLAEMNFDQVAVHVPVTELHLNEQQIAEMKEKKEQAIERQEQKKKTNKKRKKKGVASFMEDESEMKQFKTENRDETSSQSKGNGDREVAVEKQGMDFEELD